MDSRYEPPKTAVLSEAARPTAGLKALSLGLLVSVGAGLVVALGYTMLCVVFLPDAQLEMQEKVPVLIRVSPYSPVFVWLSVADLVFSALGGYVCAKVARSRNLWLGVSLACLTVLCRALLTPMDQLLVIFAILAGLTFVSVLLGTAFGLRRMPT